MSSTAGTRDFAMLVEIAWHERTKGELWITRHGIEGDDFDADLRAIIDTLSVYARTHIQVIAAAQFDAHGNELDLVTDHELAGRIAAAIDLVLYGGPRG